LPSITRRAMQSILYLVLVTLVGSPHAATASNSPKSWITVDVVSFDGESITAQVVINVLGNHENGSVWVYGEIYKSNDDESCKASICLRSSVTVSVGRLVREVSYSSDTNITMFRYAARFASTYQLGNAVLGMPVFPLDVHRLSLGIGTDLAVEIDTTERILVLPSANYEGFYRVTSMSTQDNQYMYNLALEIRHPSGFAALMFALTWGTLLLLAILVGALFVYQRQDNAHVNANIVTICAAMVVFIPVFELALQDLKSPLGITLSDALLFALLIPNVLLLVRAFRGRSGAGLPEKGASVRSEPSATTAPTQTAPSHKDLKVLQNWMSEENALRSFDLVYFLLLPAMLFAIQYVRQSQTRLGPLESVMLSLVFPAAMFSLPFGVHATLASSVAGRIRAWTIFTLLSGFGLGAALLLHSTSLILPSFFPLTITYPTPMLLWITLVLSLWIFGGFGIGASWWMHWINKTFLRRLPSKTSEIENALNYLVLKNLVKPYMKGDWKGTIRLVGLGLLLYAAFWLFYWLRTLGWNVP